MIKLNLDSSDDGNLGNGDSPLVDVKEAVASIPADILEQPPDPSPQTSQAPAATLASSDSTASAPILESSELAEGSVVSVS